MMARPDRSRRILTMKAALYREAGDSSVLVVEDVATPDPGPGEVRVHLALSGINPTDWKSRSGATGQAPDGFQIPHHDGSGVIDAVGVGVVDRHVGQRVWLYLAAFGNRYGTAAEYAVVPAERTVTLPDTASDELGACLGVPALTAAHCLGGDPAALAGTTVLVAGGAGAVGHYAIELARFAGARVITTVSSEAKAALAYEAGADAVVNYRDPDAIDQVRAFAPSVERIVEVALGANLELDLAVSAAGTVIAVYANEPADPVIPTRRLMATNTAIHYVLLYGVSPAHLAAATSWTLAATDAQALSALPIVPFALHDVAAAHDAVEHGTVGKVVVVPG
jgi:NADPH:quinone reductase